MLAPRHLAFAGAAVVLTACASSRRASEASAANVSPGAAAVAQAVQWTTTLTPQSGTSITGSASAVADTNPEQTTATVTLSGATPGAVHPWHIHSGRCGDNGPIVGPAAAYTPITVGPDGSAAVTATLPFATPASGDYYVNVHRSPTEMGTIVACGNLTIGTR